MMDYKDILYEHVEDLYSEFEWENDFFVRQMTYDLHKRNKYPNEVRILEVMVEYEKDRIICLVYAYSPHYGKVVNHMSCIQLLNGRELNRNEVINDLLYGLVKQLVSF